MRFLISFAAVAAAAMPAYSNDCIAGTDTAFVAEQWEIVTDSQRPAVRYDLRSKLEKGVRMVESYLVITDPLGREIGKYFFIPDDLIVPAGGVTEVVSGGLPGEGDRLSKLQPADLTLTVCTRGVVYDDGSVVKFE